MASSLFNISAFKGRFDAADTDSCCYIKEPMLRLNCDKLFIFHLPLLHLFSFVCVALFFILILSVCHVLLVKQMQSCFQHILFSIIFIVLPSKESPFLN